ncbi:MAG TPA: type II secretion system F family protein [Pirellulaceae bacterium]|nr:type II secretion system F family protein [Pirellulaceae bacterium]HMO92781.1 type II secretion system F family protein [Pirellulaceae bacterium]HMP69363.1 type II secretion system F family protein [Pirellulaceae bacterium]
MSKIALKTMSDLAQRVGTGYRAGIDIRSIWTREARFGSIRNQEVARQIAEEIDAGVSLAKAMENRGDYFPQLAIAIVSAGEQGGRLDQAFLLLHEHYQKMLHFRRTVLASISWSLFELVGSVFVIGALIWIMHFVTQWSGAKPIDWLGFGWSTTQYFALFVFVVFAFFGSIVVLVVGTSQGWFGLLPMKIARKLPLLGSIIENLAYSRFAWALAAVVESGINIKWGIRQALRATGNFFYSELEDEVHRSLEEGNDLTAALTETSRFSSEFLMYVENGELTGEIPETMQRTADEYLDRVNTGFLILAKMLFFLCFAIVGFIICIAIILLFKAVILDPRNEIIRDLGF